MLDSGYSVVTEFSNCGRGLAAARVVGMMADIIAVLRRPRSVRVTGEAVHEHDTM